MRIAIFSDSINIPPKEGINVHTYELLCSLAELSNVEMYLVVADRGWLDFKLLHEMPFKTIVMPPDEFYSVERISSILDEYRIDICQTYMMYFAARVLKHAATVSRIPWVIEIHDLEEKVAPIYGLSEQKIKYHIQLQLEVVQSADLVRVMSSHDYSIITSNWSKVSKNNIIHLPVGMASMHSSSRATLKDKYNPMVFVGNLSYPPNKEAADILANQLLDLVLHDIHIVGRGSEEYCNGLGIVEDLDHVLLDSSIGLAPIQTGSGMKIKIMSYLRASLPVITTTIGAHGYPQSDAIKIEDDITLWPKIIEDIMQDYDRVSTKAEQLFQENFELKNVNHRLIEQYSEIIANYTPRQLNEVCEEVNQDDIYWLKEVRETPRKPVTDIKVFV